MNRTIHTNVFAAFEMLLEELEGEVASSWALVAAAREGQDTRRARVALERIEQVTDFRDRVFSLRKDWEVLAVVPPRDAHEEGRAPRASRGKTRRGERTPEQDYYVPILQALMELGGRGKVPEVLRRVEVWMRPVLRDVDYEGLRSDASIPRWRNAAQWARQAMVQDGLLVADSPRGVWEATEAGKALLDQRRERAASGEDSA